VLYFCYFIWRVSKFENAEHIKFPLHSTGVNDKPRCILEDGKGWAKCKEEFVVPEASSEREVARLECPHLERVSDSCRQAMPCKPSEHLAQLTNESH
jgi:hypothetical protein